MTKSMLNPARVPVTRLLSGLAREQLRDLAESRAKRAGSGNADQLEGLILEELVAQAWKREQVAAQIDSDTCPDLVNTGAGTVRHWSENR